MDRRQIVGASAAALFSAGVACGLASLNPVLSAYHTLLVSLSGSGLIAGVTAWTVLGVTADEATRKDRQYLSMLEAGERVYERGSEKLRAVIREGVPDPFKSISHHGAAFVFEAARKGALQLFGRRAPELSLEPVSVEEADPNSYDAMFRLPPKVHDISIRRRDWRIVKRTYGLK
jgi:hypothetical protein